MFHIYWPVLVFITLFLVVGVIIVMLRFGPRLCKLRHHTLPEKNDWQHKEYDHGIGFESFA